MNPEKPPHRAGFAAVIGRPNVGKSTLVNTLLGQKIAPVSPRAQTTRRRQLGILTLPEAQVVFVDTPGLHQPVHQLGEYMNQVAEDALADADVLLWLVDASVAPTLEDQQVAARLESLYARLPAARERTLLLLNKSDLVIAPLLASRADAYSALLTGVTYLPISAATGMGQSILLAEVIRRLPEGEAFYSEDQITDLYERDIAAELVREAALLHLRDEVPHCIAVRVDEFKEREDSPDYIGVTIFVEKDSQKGIVIGKGGEMIKKLGQTARAEIEAMTGRKVYLEIRVKVNKNWRSNPSALKLLGYVVEKDE